jgi:hypothetical protein
MKKLFREASVLFRDVRDQYRIWHIEVYGFPSYGQMIEDIRKSAGFYAPQLKKVRSFPEAARVFDIAMTALTAGTVAREMKQAGRTLETLTPDILWFAMRRTRIQLMQDHPELARAEFFICAGRASRDERREAFDAYYQGHSVSRAAKLALI